MFLGCNRRFYDMKRAVFLLLIYTFFANTAFPQNLDDYFSQVNSFLSLHVENGKVNYKAIAQNFDEIKAIYVSQCHIDLRSTPEGQKKAFYINAYNIIVIYQIARYYEFNQKSPMDQSGFFDRIKHKVAGEMITLNQLEIKKLLMTYKDPRIHFVLACAAKSCPPLASFAYVPEKLERQLDERAWLTLNNDSWLRLRPGQQKVELSKIFDWYKRDFVSGGNTLIQYINQYRKTPIPGNFAIEFYEYDWSLNEG